MIFHNFELQYQGCMHDATNKLINQHRQKYLYQYPKVKKHNSLVDIAGSR
jgi:hypothetical protein